METQVNFHFLSSIRNRLAKKNYIEVRPPLTYEIAMMKQTFGGTIPKVVAVLDATLMPYSAPDVYQQHQKWFGSLLGNTGAGILLFVYNQPTATEVEEILQLGHGMLGYGQVVAGVYDVSNNKYWLTSHMGWPDELFK